MNIDWKRISKGGIVGVIGFLLSPFSWWNDLLVNIPIAYIIGFLVSKVIPGSFLLVFIGAYWGTNQRYFDKA